MSDPRIQKIRDEIDEIDVELLRL
ncbi:MAG: hypothetical protein AAB305_01400, partial [Candidatus Zixiibacteriota bacterium]